MKRGMQQLIGIGLAFAACNATAGKFVERQHERVVEGRYIVAYEDQDAEIAAMISQRLMDASRANGFRVEQTWKDAVYGAVISGLDDEKARQIAKMPGIDFVKNDTYLTLDTIQTSAPWGLDRIDQRNLPLSTTYEYNYVASGVSVYIVDTTLVGTDPEFDSMFSWGGGAISRVTNVYDAHGGPSCSGAGASWVHGTQMASIVGGRTLGVAKNVQLKGVRVTDCAGNPWESSVIAGLNWIVANGTQPAVINLSIGFNVYDPSLSLLDNAIESAYNAGYFLSKSAGNVANDACTQQPTLGVVTALYTAAASVNDDKFSPISSYGSCVDIIAPGAYVESFPVLSHGTSPAAAHVSGAAALIYDANPTYTPAQVAALLTSRATAGAITSVPAGTVNLLLYTAP